MSLIGKITGTDGAKRAAKDADLMNRKLVADTDTRNTGYLRPYVDTGVQANSQVNALLGLGGDVDAARAAFDQFRDGTGYNFRLNQGMDAVNTGAASRGALGSGKTLKALTQYGQNLATGSFNDYIAQLLGQQNLGYNATGQQVANNNAMLDRGIGITNNRANAVANASLVNGGFVTNALGALAGGAFGGAGSPMGSSYGGGASMDPFAIAKTPGYSF